MGDSNVPVVSVSADVPAVSVSSEASSDGGGSASSSHAHRRKIRSQRIHTLALAFEAFQRANQTERQTSPMAHGSALSASEKQRELLAEEQQRVVELEKQVKELQKQLREKEEVIAETGRKEDKGGEMAAKERVGNDGEGSASEEGSRVASDEAAGILELKVQNEHLEQELESLVEIAESLKQELESERSRRVALQSLIEDGCVAIGSVTAVETAPDASESCVKEVGGEERDDPAWLKEKVLQQQKSIADLEGCVQQLEKYRRKFRRLDKKVKSGAMLAPKRTMSKDKDRHRRSKSNVSVAGDDAGGE